MIDIVDGQLFIETNFQAPNNRLVVAGVKAPGIDNWKDLVKETENVLSTSYGGGKLFASYLVDAKTEINQHNYDGELESKVQLPGIGTVFGFGAKKEETQFYYSFTSFTYPSAIYRYDVLTGESTAFRETDLDIDPDDYETKQIFYESQDGTRVPMFIVHKKGLELNGKKSHLALFIWWF